jgi:peptidase M28-like protein
MMFIMKTDPIPNLIRKINCTDLSKYLFSLSKHPLQCRKVNYTMPGHEKNSLDEADVFIASQLESYGYKIEREVCRAQAYRRDISKTINSQYSPPMPEDPWYDLYNIYAKKEGTEYPEKIIILLAHKDSQSWIDSPGAYDNAAGTVAIMEIARVLRSYESKHSFWFLFCNEECTPLTCLTAADNAKSRGDNIIAVINVDAIGGKSMDDIKNARKTNVTVFATPEGERIANMMVEANIKYEIGLAQNKYRTCSLAGDDGAFIKAGYPAAVMNIGSYPYNDPNYHTLTDVPELVDIDNILMATCLSLAGAVKFDRES